MSSTVPKTELVPWINNLPPDWETYRVDSVADVLFSNVDKHTLDEEVPVLLCNYVDVYRNEKITGAINFMGASAEPREIKRFQLNRGDVLVTKDSETPDDIAITALVSEELPGVLCGYHLAMLRPRSKRICGPYLAWLHSSKQFRAQYEAKAVGVTRFGLPQYAFRSAVIPLPSLPEQERIAAYLDASCAALDAAVTAKRRQLDTLEALRKDIINRAVTFGIGNAPLRRIDEDWIGQIPAHWEACRIKRILSRVDYGISQSTEQEGVYPVLKMGHIQDGEIVFNGLDFVDEVSEELLLEKGDLLFNRTNSPDQVAKAAVFRGAKEDRITYASYLVRLRMNHRADPYFLNYVLNSSGFLSFARKLAIPSVQQSNLNSTRYCRMLVPLPPLHEQLEIAAFLDQKMVDIKRVVATLNQQISTLLAYRKSLIHECVTGQRRVTEADMARLKNDNSSGMM